MHSRLQHGIAFASILVEFAQDGVGRCGHRGIGAFSVRRIASTAFNQCTAAAVGQQFEVHLYENFVDGKAGDFHTAAYQWKEDNYVRGSGLARDAKRFVAQALAVNDFLLQSTDSNNLFNYWIGRKLSVGVYLIIPLDEADADDATCTGVCGKDQPEGICQVETYEQLLKMARATAAKPVRNAALGVVLTK